MDQEQNVAQTVEESTTAEPATPAEEQASAAVEKQPAESDQSGVQTKEQNAEYARRRREAERAASDEKIRVQSIIDALDGVNPFTGEEMKDAADVAEWQKMKQIKAAGGDPVADYRKTVKEEARQQRTKEQTEADQRAWFDSDRQSFIAKYPNVKLAGPDGLLMDKGFQTYAQGKVGKVPLIELKEGYDAFRESIRKEEAAKAAQVVANAQATPGSLSSPDGDKKTFTYAEVKNMSAEERAKHIDAIMESRKNW